MVRFIIVCLSVCMAHINQTLVSQNRQQNAIEKFEMKMQAEQCNRTK